MKRIVTPGSPAIVLALVLALASAAGARPSDPPADVRTTEANITRLTAGFLEQSQFAHHPLDAQLATKLLDRYLDALDGSRSIFLQSDADEFAKLTPDLAGITRVAGDTKIAHVVFARYLQRLGQQSAYVDTLLRTEKFDFTGHDVYSFDRTHSPRPRDLIAAQTLWRQQLRSEYLQELLDHKAPAQIAAVLSHRHQQQLRVMEALGNDEVLSIYLDALAHVYDPHSDYLGREEMETFSIAMNLSLFGIGASLDSKDGYCNIRELIPGGPAALSGRLKPGDRIVAVTQLGREPVDIVNMPLSRSVELIRGPKGSTVTLSIVPAGAADGSVPTRVSLVRDKINLADQRAHARVVDFPSGAGTIRLGVIDLPSFYADIGDAKGEGHPSATADVARLLTKLESEHVRGIVLDLRQNGGGSLDEAISLTGLFIRRGPVVQTRGPGGDIEVGNDDDAAVQYDGPLVLLTSRFSASASEILAGALQDYGRAVIVGDTSTFGKGTVQSIVPLAKIMDQHGLAHAFDPGALKVTIRKFYRPSGASTQLRGVASDIVLPSTSDVADFSEASLQDPLPWDTIPPARYDRLDRIQPYVATLQARSAHRVATDKDFEDLEGAAARLKTTLSTKSISLNEAERRQELAQDDARQAKRAREDRVRRTKKPVTYEITVANASSPGLPAPSLPGKAGVPPSSAEPDDSGDSKDTAAERTRWEDTILNETLNVLADYVYLIPSAPTETGRGVTRATRSGPGPS